MKLSDIIKKYEGKITSGEFAEWPEKFVRTCCLASPFCAGVILELGITSGKDGSVALPKQVCATALQHI